MYDLGVSYTFYFRKKIMESSVILLHNGDLILNGKENKQAEIKVQFKKPIIKAKLTKTNS